MTYVKPSQRHNVKNDDLLAANRALVARREALKAEIRTIARELAANKAMARRREHAAYHEDNMASET